MYRVKKKNSARNPANAIARYSDSELEVIADFLRRTVEAGRKATDELAERGERQV